MAPPSTPDTPANKIEIIGVIKAIGPEPNRITIAYEPVAELNWPAGSMPFTVSKLSLMDVAKVGDRVRFKLDSHQISELRPY